MSIIFKKGFSLSCSENVVVAITFIETLQTQKPEILNDINSQQFSYLSCTFGAECINQQLLMILFDFKKSTSFISVFAVVNELKKYILIILVCLLIHSELTVHVELFCILSKLLIALHFTFFELLVSLILFIILFGRDPIIVGCSVHFLKQFLQVIPKGS